MDYKKRLSEYVLGKAVNQSKVVLITGARQVGKTTLAKNYFNSHEFITMDDDTELMLASSDRNLFFKDRSFPIIIDEAQYVPDLFRKIKALVDGWDKKGQIILTGSQSFKLLEATAQFLSGRVSIVELSGFSMRELYGVDYNTPFIPDNEYFNSRGKCLRSYKNIWEMIHRGSFPELMDPGIDREWFFRDYIRTYIERDLRRAVNIQDEIKYRNFLVSLAARSGGMLVYDDIAKDIGADSKTVMRWTSILAESGLVKLIYTYQSNVLKRVIKAPKVYFMDTGLLCYLTGWNSVDSAKRGAMAGEIFETFVVSELIKSFYNAGKDAGNIYYYRDKDKNEVDILILEGQTLYPIEIKKGATPGSDWCKGFKALNKIKDKTIAPGIVLSQVEKPTVISESATAWPVEYL